ncbi:MAG: spore maturation protein [Clostridiales bacterium]|nr:spore maturation protein [Clostridiales bacterium]
MVDFVWLLLLLAGIITGLLTGQIEQVSQAAFASAGAAVKLCIEMAGMLAMWLGIFRLAEKSGLLSAIARLASPLIRWLFPGLPKTNPAFPAIAMNLAANMLGLGNAATPFGLKAMGHLQELNPDKAVASSYMITFLALNTTCVTLIPALVISLRSQAGSALPAEIMLPAFCSSLTGTIFAVLFDRWLRRRGQMRN